MPDISEASYAQGRKGKMGKAPVSVKPSQTHGWGPVDIESYGSTI